MSLPAPIEPTEAGWYWAIWKHRPQTEAELEVYHVYRVMIHGDWYFRYQDDSEPVAELLNLYEGPIRPRFLEDE
jgi:hypothetical protein